MIKRYVKIVGQGTFLVQGPACNPWGFSLYDDDQAWPGGFGFGEWETIPARDVPRADRERLGWLFHEHMTERR